jgi:hypothetical protein
MLAAKTYGHNHSDGSPSAILVRVNVLLCINTSLHSKSPPVLFAVGDVAPGPEEQWGVGKEGNEHRDPNPNILPGILFCLKVSADPTPILLPATIQTNPGNITIRKHLPQQEFRRSGNPEYG